MFELVAAIYLAGVVIGLLVMRDRWPVRLTTAFAWPLGIVAFVVVVVVLSFASVYLWPVPVLITAAALAALWFAV